MALKVNCPNCFKSYRFAEETAGMKYQCKACEQQFVIGNPALANVAVPAPSPTVQISACHRQSGANDGKSALNRTTFTER
jgi:hypothetical protein